MPLKDPVARREYHSNYNRDRYKNDPEFRKQQISRVRATEVRKKKASGQLIAQFRSRGCAFADCPETSPCCLTAHHLNPEEKDFNVGDALRRRLSSARVQAELAKCVCLCFNCHAKVHAEEKILSEDIVAEWSSGSSSAS